MKQLKPYNIWIGNARDCANRRLVAELEIQAVIQLAIEEPIPPLLRDVCFYRFPLCDGAGNDVAIVKSAVQTISQLISAHQSSLVCCSAGLSRSPAVVACAIAIAKNREPHDCLTELSQTIPTDVSPGLWNDLLNAVG